MPLMFFRNGTGSDGTWEKMIAPIKAVIVREINLISCTVFFLPYNFQLFQSPLFRSRCFLFRAFGAFINSQSTVCHSSAAGLFLSLPNRHHVRVTRKRFLFSVWTGNENKTKEAE